MSLIELLFLINYSLVVIFVLAMIVKGDKKPIRVFAWTIAMIIPFIGLLAYIYIGKGIASSTKHMLKNRKLKNEEYDKILGKEVNVFKQNFKNDENIRKDLILLNLNNAKSIFSLNNSINIFTNGPQMLDSLKKDIINAKKTINLMFYIFANDKTGKEIRDLLTEKAKQGVEVKVIYDAIGSPKTNKKFFENLIKAGGEVKAFFPSMFGIKWFNVYMNYRHHRKIVVIDGKTAYTGGLNLRDDHMGLHKKLSPWRDTHLKIEGPAVYSLQNIFISDWRYVNKKYLSTNLYLNENYYAPANTFVENRVGVQVVDSSPEMNNEPIKECLIKMINSAKDTIRIQTPYFIPDDIFKGALSLALLSGVKVEIMIPRIPDHKTVWYATLSYIKELQEMGAKIYFYNGFLHSKTLSIDDDIVTIGSCNMDIRSFSLNFEVNTVIYNEEISKKHKEIFEEDKKNCEIIEKTYFMQIGFAKKLMMKWCRLFSAIF